jgi:hypothetical protein
MRLKCNKVHFLYKMHPPCSCNRENIAIATGHNPVGTQTDPAATVCDLVATQTDPVATGCKPVSTQTDPVATGHNQLQLREWVHYNKRLYIYVYVCIYVYICIYMYVCIYTVGGFPRYSFKKDTI